MPSSGYTAFTFTAGETPTTTQWNILSLNDASFNSGAGFNDGAIAWRHLSTDMVPTGMIRMYAGIAAPSSQWLICDGSPVSRSTYAALFAICSTNYGAGNGTSTFNLPNLAAAMPGGYKSGDTNFGAIGATGGETTHVLTATEMPSHGHTVNDPSHGHTTAAPYTTGAGGVNYGSGIPPHNGAPSGNTWNGSAYNNTTGIYLSNSGGGGAHNNLPPFTTVQFIIKT